MSSQPHRLNQRAHIVVADEQPELLDFLVRTLRSDGHCVFQAYDGLAALELSMVLSHPELLVTNTKMPGLMGPELIREVRKSRPKLPILCIKNHGLPQGPLPESLPADVPTLEQPFKLLALVRPLQAPDD